MNRISRSFFLFLIFTYFSLCLAGCTGSTAIFCCMQYPAHSDLATYCNNHSFAIGRFVRSDDDALKQRERLDNFKRLYDSVKNCSTIECIEAHITSSTALPRLLEEYQKKHQAAEDDTQVEDSLKAHLILCGFGDAIGRMEQVLSEENQ